MRGYTNWRRTILEQLPAGSVSVMQFSFTHGVPVRTLKRHIINGLDAERIEATEFVFGEQQRQTWRYLTPDQQRRALEFWERHGVKYRKPAMKVEAPQ